MRWRTVTAIDHPLLILLRINNWCLCTFTYLWPTVTVKISWRRFDRWKWRMIGHMIDTKRTELIKRTIWILGDKVTVSVKFCDIDFKEVVMWSLIVRSYSCDWRCGRISYWAGFRKKRRWSDEHLYPSTVIEDRSWTRDVFMLKIASRWQSVNQWKSTTTSSEDSGSTKQIASLWDEHC